MEIVNGLRAEACADKSETAVGLIVIAGGDEGEAVGGTKTSNIGGALLAKVGSDCKVAAGGPAAFIGAVLAVLQRGEMALAWKQSNLQKSSRKRQTEPRNARTWLKNCLQLKKDT